MENYYRPYNGTLIKDVQTTCVYCSEIVGYAVVDVYSNTLSKQKFTFVCRDCQDTLMRAKELMQAGRAA